MFSKFAFLEMNNAVADAHQRWHKLVYFKLVMCFKLVKLHWNGDKNLNYVTNPKSTDLSCLKRKL